MVWENLQAICKRITFGGCSGVELEAVLHDVHNDLLSLWCQDAIKVTRNQQYKY